MVVGREYHPYSTCTTRRRFLIGIQGSLCRVRSLALDAPPVRVAEAGLWVVAGGARDDLFAS